MVSVTRVSEFVKARPVPAARVFRTCAGAVEAAATRDAPAPPASASVTGTWGDVLVSVTRVGEAVRARPVPATRFFRTCAGAVEAAATSVTPVPPESPRVTGTWGAVLVSVTRVGEAVKARPVPAARVFRTCAGAVEAAATSDSPTPPASASVTGTWGAVLFRVTRVSELVKARPVPATRFFRTCAGAVEVVATSDAPAPPASASVVGCATKAMVLLLELGTSCIPNPPVSPQMRREPSSARGTVPGAVPAFCKVIVDTSA